MARILLIEDDDILRVLVKRALERKGHMVEEASDGRQGVASYRRSQPDLVITDLLMPVQDGLETINHLTDEFPDAKIIAISGSTTILNIDILPAARGFGAMRTFTKPVDTEDLLSAVDDLVGASGATLQ